MNEPPISVDVFGTGIGAFAATADTIIDWAMCQLFARLCRIPDTQKMALLHSLCGVSQAYAGCRVLAKNLPLRPSLGYDRKVPWAAGSHRQQATNPGH